MKKTLATLFLLTCLGSSSAYADNALILQTDFSLKDGAVSAMKGVAFGVDHNLKISELTHEIPPYNIWEGAYRLYQTASTGRKVRCLLAWSIQVLVQSVNR